MGNKSNSIERGHDIKFVGRFGTSSVNKIAQFSNLRAQKTRVDSKSKYHVMMSFREKMMHQKKRLKRWNSEFCLVPLHATEYHFTLKTEGQPKLRPTEHQNHLALHTHTSSISLLKISLTLLVLSFNLPTCSHYPPNILLLIRTTQAHTLQYHHNTTGWRLQEKYMIPL